MKLPLKFFTLLLLCLFVDLEFGASTGICESQIEDLRISAEKGDLEAQVNLGIAYAKGEGIPKDEVEAVRWIRRAAEKGFAKAQFILGAVYFEGLGGVPKNYVQAVKWIRKAAEQGFADAQFELGEAYAKGGGVSKDYVEAVKWYRQAAEQGHAKGQLHLAWAYTKGEGIPKDEVEAVKWYRKAAEQGLAEAQFQLAWAYGTGKGVPEDITEGVKWYRKADEHRLSDGISVRNRGAWAYGIGEGVPRDDADVVRWYRKAAENGFADAQFRLGWAYRIGKAVPKDEVEAVKWYRQAAEQGHAEAQHTIGRAYEEGIGVPKDYVEALAWYNIAAASGANFAPYSRNILEKQLGPQVSLLYQQRSKEILKEIESAKQNRAKTERSGQRQSRPPDGDTELKGSGTGVFVKNDGLILTAAHVISQSASINVITQQGVKTARVVKQDAANDLALLKCDGDFQAVPVKSSSRIKLGQSVFTIGFPNIGFQGFSPKMTKGEISSLSGLQDDPRHWQISVPVQPGNSGGPLFDEAGNVVGVVLAKLDAIKVAKATGDLTQNVNYAIKSIYALPMLEAFGANLPSESGVWSSLNKLENVVEKVQGAVVLILVY
jgi:TPR repeat protein